MNKNTALALAQRLDGDLVGPDRPYTTVGPIDTAGADALSFAVAEIPNDCTAGVILCHAPKEGHCCIVVDDPKLAFIGVLREMFPVEHTPGVHRNASVEPSAKIHPSAEIHAGAVIGAECTVGPNSVLFPGVVLYPGTRVGDNCRIHAGSVLGADGFSFHPTPDGPIKVPQIGHVIIEDNVEIGANCTIDRAFLGNTRIGPGCKLDNLVHVGHNSQLGRHVIIAAQTGLGGSVTIEDGVVIGGQVGVVEHVRIGAGARVGAQSGLGQDVPPGQAVLGTPALSLRRMRRIYAAIRYLPEMWRGWDR
jgi:UDP-3-O-[3-hydroxymyristoyl] glucosamine N-acyltransferase